MLGDMQQDEFYDMPKDKFGSMLHNQVGDRWRALAERNAEYMRINIIVIIHNN